MDLNRKVQASGYYDAFHRPHFSHEGRTPCGVVPSLALQLLACPEGYDVSQCCNRISHSLSVRALPAHLRRVSITHLFEAVHEEWKEVPIVGSLIGRFKAAVVTLAILAAAVGCATQPSARSATRALFGTWVNPEYDRYAESGEQVEIGKTLFSVYPGKLVLEGQPNQPMCFLFEESSQEQTDMTAMVLPVDFRVEDDGTIFHKLDWMLVDLSGLASGEGMAMFRTFMVLRLSPDRNGIEFNLYPAHDHASAPHDFPDDLNPDGDWYHVYFRAE